MRVWDKIMGRSVVDLAGEVDEALGRLAYAKGQQAEIEEALRLISETVKTCEADVAAARDALFQEHPGLVVGLKDQYKETPQPLAALGGDVHPDPSNPALLPGQDPSKFEVVEVDDADDPRFTGGVPISPKDDDDLPPVQWEEHDG